LAGLIKKNDKIKNKKVVLRNKAIKGKYSSQLILVLFSLVVGIISPKELRGTFI